VKFREETSLNYFKTSLTSLKTSLNVSWRFQNFTKSIGDCCNSPY
jgi:hypothetical protein